MVSHPKTLSAELYRFPPARAARRSKTHEANSNRSPLSLCSKHQKIRFHPFQLFEPFHPLLHPPLSVLPELAEGRGGGKAAPSHIEERWGLELLERLERLEPSFNLSFPFALPDRESGCTW
jgi:hypothetical protein